MRNKGKSRKDFKKHKVITQALLNRIRYLNLKDLYIQLYKEFDPGSGRTLAARLTHASRTEII